MGTKKPLEDARIHAMLTYRTPQSFDSRFGRTKNQELEVYNIESWLMYHGDKLAKRFKLKAYQMMNHLLASVNIEREGKSVEDIIKKINAEIHLIAIDSDLFFTPGEDRKTFEIGKKIKKNIFYHELNSIHGHDAFLIENEKMARILAKINAFIEVSGFSIKNRHTNRKRPRIRLTVVPVCGAARMIVSVGYGVTSVGITHTHTHTHTQTVSLLSVALLV